MKIYQKMKKLILPLAIELLWEFLRFVISSTTPVDVTPSTGVTVDACPDDITETVSGTGTTLSVSWTPPTATDSNDNPLAIAIQSHSPGTSFQVGDTKVTVFFTDDVGNADTCTFTVTVSQPASTGATIVACPDDLPIITAVAEQSAIASWPPPTATDSNGTSLTAAASHSPGDTFTLGDTTVSYTFTDHAGNTASCVFTVTVNPNPSAPRIANCPESFTMLTYPGAQDVAVPWTEPTATDNYNVPLSFLSRSHSPGDTFSLGTAVVSYVFQDSLMVRSTCTFTVTVQQPPPSTGVTITACPADFTQGTREMSAIVTWTPPTAIDSGGYPLSIATRSHTPGTFGPGVSTVSTTFTDDAANSATCTFTVTIEVGLMKTYEFYLADDAINPAATNPFLIETSADLATLASLVNDESSYTPVGGTASNYRASAYRLENSLDLSTGYTHIPIGTGTSFTGTFDGNGQTLRNLTYNGSHAALGLFSVIDGATISDLTLMDPAITNTTTDTNHFTGALVGTSAGTSVISNVSVIGGTIQGRRYVGGLVGYQSSGTITASSATGDVSGDDYVGGLVGRSYGTITASTASGDVSGDDYVGGLVGRSYGTITASSATGDVSGDDYVGGLVGRSYGTITASTATGAVSGSSNVGGLVGFQDYGGTITDSSATGKVTGSSNVGGLVGSQDRGGDITASTAKGDVSGTGGNTGGLVGKQDDGTITASYATGAVMGSSRVGGIVGYQFSGTITASYATGAVSGTSNNVGGIVGYQFSGTITASYATGAVSGMSQVGGLVGSQDHGTITASYASGDVSGDDNVGGLVGWQSGSITASYATGAVMGTSLVGGLVGRQVSGGITASYWDTQTSGRSRSAGGTGYTTAQLQVLGGAGTIYETWTTPPWTFMAGAYPTLSP